MSFTVRLGHDGDMRANAVTQAVAAGDVFALIAFRAGGFLGAEAIGLNLDREAFFWNVSFSGIDRAPFEFPLRSGINRAGVGDRKRRGGARLLICLE